MTTVLEKDQAEIRRGVFEMATAVKDALRSANRAFRNHDLDLADDVIAGDADINQAWLELDQLCSRVLAIRHLVATNLRGVLAAVRISSHLERIGDHAAHIAEKTMSLKDRAQGASADELFAMGETAIAMVGGSAQAFLDRDVRAARLVNARDEEIDVLFAKLTRRLLREMAEDRHRVDRNHSLLEIGRSLERIGDRVRSICEMVVYDVMGKQVEMNR